VIATRDLNPHGIAQQFEALMFAERADEFRTDYLAFARGYYDDFDPIFDRLYCDGLLASRESPFPFGRRDRFRDLLRCLSLTHGLTGRLAECGCLAGLSSYLICTQIRRQAPRYAGEGYEIYDSFQGLSTPTADDLPLPPRMKAGHFAAPLKEVVRTLQDYPKIGYVPGWLPGTLDHGRRQTYRFVHVDVDLYVPTLGALRYFWPRLVPGGVMVCDDYSWPGARRAVQRFSSESNAALHLTPSGTCYVVKVASA
jgi:O-methyltransferase